ncbi:MAG TPA: hypothetical protein VFU32_15795 [Ktedonobacterales bacterium]|nr:hypothetical protein [Ktedonobacterales bacterium]
MAGSQDNGLRQQSATQTPQGTTGGKAQRADMGLNQALEQQITQAIQPALDEFRQRMAELSGQMAAMPAQQSPTRQAHEPPAAPEAAPQQKEDKQALESQPQQALTQVQHITERPLAGALTSAVQTVGRYSAQWLQSMLVAGLGALLAESAHAAVQQRAEQGLHTLLQKAFEAAPADFANQGMQEKTERTLQLILREALDEVFAEGVRTSVLQGGQQTIQQSLRGDFGGALKTVEETPQVLMAALITVLRRHQQTILRLLLALALLAVASSLEHSKN